MQRDLSVPKHVMTLDWLGGDGGTRRVTWAAAAPHTTWAFTNSSDSVAIHAAGIKTIYYTQPNRQAPGGPEYSSDNSTFAHDCTGARIRATNFTNHYLMYPASTHLGALWANEVTTATGSWGGVFDAIFEDLSDTVAYTDAKPCGFDQTTWSADSNLLITHVTAVGFPVFYNGLAALSGHSGTEGVSPVIALNLTAAGGMFEGCYLTSGAFPKLHLGVWVATEETELAMAIAGKKFVCSALDLDAAAQSTNERMYYYASLLLTHHQDSTIAETHFMTPNDFHVLPETEFVPGSPAFSIKAVSQLEKSPDVFARQFDNCYLDQVSVGACAVAVNIDPTADHPFPWRGSYARTLVLTGADVLEGGKATIEGIPPPALMPALSAVIAVR